MTEVTQQHPSTHPSTGAPTDHGSAKLIFNWLKLAESALGNNSDRLNAINIFPVPDGDTASNLYHTVPAATRASEAVAEAASLGTALSLAATPSLEPAPGNSGPAIAVMLKPLAERVPRAPRLNAPLLSQSLPRGRAAAWGPLSGPQERTMLS